MPSTPTRPTLSAIPRGNVKALLLCIPLAVGAVFVGLLLAPRLSGPGHVDELSVENPTAIRVQIHVSQGPDDGTVGLGTVEAGETRTFGAVLDQGSVWVFHIREAGRDVLTVQMARSDLERNGWMFRVPDEATPASTAKER